MESRRYHIEEVLGKGGYGVVYRATMEADGGFRRPVALKRLLQADAEGIARFRDEARLLSHVRHSAVIQVDALLELDGQWTVVMEYVEGVDLLNLLQTYLLPPRATLELIAVLARALEAAWSTEVEGRPLRLVHRDIKPGNIRLTAHGDVKLLDFGLATAAFAKEVKTQHGVTLGTPAYMAPERLAGKGGSPADVYALGLCLAECLGAQRNLYLGYGDEAQFAGEVRALVEQLPTPVRGLVGSMLAYHEGGRPTVADVAARCDALAATIGGQTLVAWASEAVAAVPAPLPNHDDPLVGRQLTEGTGRRPAGKPRRWWWAAFVVVLLGGGAAAVVGAVTLGGAAWWVARDAATYERGEPTVTYRTRTSDIGREVTASRDGRWIAFRMGDRSVLEEVATGQQRFVAKKVAGLKYNLALSPDGSRLAFTTLTHVYVIHLTGDQFLREIQPYRSYTLAWGPSGQRLLAARDDPGNDADSFLYVQDLATDEREILHRGGVEHATWWPSGEGFFVWPEKGTPFSIALDGTRVGDLPEDLPMGFPSPEGTWVWTEEGGEERAFLEASIDRLGKLGTPREVGVAVPHLRSVALTSAGWFAVSCEPGNVVHRAALPEAGDHAESREMWSVPDDVSSIAVSPGGTRAVMRDATTLEWPPGQRSEGWDRTYVVGFLDEETVAVAGFRDGVESAWLVGADGEYTKLQATERTQVGAVDRRGRLWARNGGQLVVLTPSGNDKHGLMPFSDLNVVAMSPSGRRFASVQFLRTEHGQSQGLRIIDTATGSILASWDKVVIGMVWEDEDTVLGSFDQALFRFSVGDETPEPAGYVPAKLSEVRDLELHADGTVSMLGQRQGDLVHITFEAR